jgi:hypothetical protein
MAADDPAAIGDDARETLAGLADVLIPPGDEMPPGSQVLIGRGQLDAVLRVRPDLVEDLRLLLERARGAEPAAEVDRLRTEDDAGFQLLATVVGGGYFLDEGVRDAIGYPGQEAIPIVPSDPPEYERDGLLAAVVERGPIYRPTPPAG